MYLSSGMRQLFLGEYTDQNSCRLTVSLWTGVAPTAAEMKQYIIDHKSLATSPIYSAQLYGSRVYGALVNMGHSMLGYTGFGNVPRQKLGVGNNQHYVNDFSAMVENLIHEADGTAGFVLIQAYDGVTPRHPNYGTYVNAMGIYTVGTIGSGADIEFTSLGITEESNLRLNEFVLRHV